MIGFDTLKAALRLQDEAGFDEHQARILVATFAEGLGEDIATRDGLAQTESVLRSDMEKMEVALRSDMKKMEVALRSDMKKMEVALRSDMNRTYAITIGI